MPSIPTISGLSNQQQLSPVNQLQDILNIVHSISSEEIKALSDLYSNISSTIIAQSVNGTNVTVVELLSGPGINATNGTMGIGTPSSANGSQAFVNESLRQRRTVDSLWPMLMNPSLVLPDLDSSESNNGHNYLLALANVTGNSTVTSNGTFNSSASQSNSTSNSSSPILPSLPTKRMKRNIAYIPTASGQYKPMMMAWTPYGPMLMPLLKSPFEQMESREMRTSKKYDRYAEERPSVMYYKSKDKKYRPSKYEQFE